MNEKVLNILILDDKDHDRIQFVKEFTNVQKFGEGGRTVRIEAQGAASIEDATVYIRKHMELSPLYILIDQVHENNGNRNWGFEATSELRKIKPDILPVVFSNIAPEMFPETGVERFRTMAFQAGAVRYLAKPRDHEEVLGVVNFLNTLAELSELKEELERQVKTQREFPALSLAMNAGLMIVDKEDIVWFASDDYCSLIGCDPQGMDSEGNVHPIPWKLKEGAINIKCRAIIQKILDNENSTSIEHEMNMFALSRSDSTHGVFLQVRISPLLTNNKNTVGICQTVTPLPEAALRSMPLVEKGDLILETIGELGFKRVRAYQMVSDSKGTKAFATLGDLGNILKEDFIDHTYTAGGDAYIEDSIKNRSPKVYWGNEFPKEKGDLDNQLGAKWPRIVAPLMVQEMGVGALFIEVDDSTAQKYERTNEFSDIEKYLSPLVHLLVQPKNDREADRGKWISEKNKLTHTLMRLRDYDNIYNEIIKVIISVSGADGGYLRIPKGDNLVIMGLYGDYAEAVKRSNRTAVFINNAYDVCSSTYRTRFPSYNFITNTKNQHNHAYQNYLTTWNDDEKTLYGKIQSDACIPLRYENIVCGILFLYSYKQGVFSPEKKRFLGEMSKDAASIIYSVTVVRENEELQRTSEINQRANISTIANQLFTVYDEEDLLWRFAIGMTHGEAVGFNRILLFRLKKGGDSKSMDIQLGHGPLNGKEGRMFREKTEEGKQIVDLSDCLEQWSKNGGKYPSSPLTERLNKSRTITVSRSCPIMDFSTVIDTLVNKSATIFHECDGNQFTGEIGDLLRDLEVKHLYCFKIPADDDYYLVGLCDFVYLENPDTKRILHLGGELVEHLAITYRHRREQREAQLQVGKRLIGRASHLLHSLIPPMMSQISLAKKYLELNDKDEVTKWLDILGVGADRAFEYLRELTEFSKLEVSLDDRLNSGEFVRWIQKEISAEYPHIHINVLLANIIYIHIINIDKRKLLAVFIEMINNSIKYSSKKEDELDITISAHINDNRICIVYEDNGNGINVRIRRSIFQPFATEATYEVGLGLSIMRYIIERHHGIIEERGNEKNETLPYPRSYSTGVYYLVQLPIEKEIVQ